MSDLPMQLVTAMQHRLAQLGDYRLRIDGLPGPGTSAAIVAFKERHGLRGRDFVGPLTLEALFAPDAKPVLVPPAAEGEPPWLVEARRHLGLREVPGRASNPAILTWARDLDQWYPGDDVAWCGLFVAHCMSVGAPDEPQDFNRLGARAWLAYGQNSGIQLGAVAVFWRTHPTTSWHGHVALVTGSSRDAIRVIGGNQGDAVTETWISRGRLLGCRKPHGADLPPAPDARTGALSTDEA